MVLRLFLVLTYLLLDSWESCESGKGKKKRLPLAANRKKQLSRSFLFTCYLKTQRMYSRSIQNFLRKEGNQERGRCGKLLGIQTVWAAQAVLPLLQGQTRHPSDQSRLDLIVQQSVLDSIVQHFGCLPVPLHNEEQVFSTSTLSFLNHQHLKDGESA